jgi:hypothetical protein
MKFEGHPSILQTDTISVQRKEPVAARTEFRAAADKQSNQPGFTMGAIADAMMAFAKPLIDATDGSMEQINKALALSQCCWNLAITPEANREDLIQKMQSNFQMNDAEFESFRRDMIMPMLERHKEMFPLYHNKTSPTASPRVFSPRPPIPSPPPPPKPAAIDPYAPCPCGSGKKFKFCCRNKGK